MASLGIQIWTALEYGFKNDEQLIKNINKAHSNYLTNHSKDNKLELIRKLLEPYEKLYDETIVSAFKMKVESRLKNDYSDFVSEIIMMIMKSCETDRLDNYVQIYEPEKSKDNSFLLYFHSKLSTDFDHIAGKYDKKSKSNGIRGGEGIYRLEEIQDKEGNKTDPLEIQASGESYIPGSDASEERIRDNVAEGLKKQSNALSAIKISDEKKRLYAINVTYEWLSGLYKKDSPDIGKTSFLRGITNDYRKFKASFVQASDEAFEIIAATSRSERRFPTKGDLAKHIGKDQSYMNKCYDAVREKIEEYEETNGLRD